LSSMTHSRFPMTRRWPWPSTLLEHEGLCMGGSTGVNVAGAIRLAKHLGPGPHHRDHPLRLRHALRLQDLQPGLPALQEPARAEMAGSAIHGAEGVRRGARVTALLFRDDAYASTCPVTVTGVNERGGILLDQTVFYATAGGQPGDKGVLTCGMAATSPSPPPSMTRTRTSCMCPPRASRHLPWATTGTAEHSTGDNRHRIMRAHTMMHLLCAAVPFPVTGSSITDDGGRIDFDIPEGQIPDRTADSPTRSTAGSARTIP
jgi:hypothetical protein